MTDHLHEIAEEAGWEADADRSLSVARAIYLHLPPDARLWLQRDEFEAADPGSLEAVLA
ncbi:MAG TPA: hypothetical protein VE173_01690 [Longimicrobiales bacterium]|nr:hypothetical protein [Longimicrobiales bacterium]